MLSHSTVSAIRTLGLLAEGALGVALAFQLLYGLLFVLIASGRAVARARQTPSPALAVAQRRGARWAIIVPVVNEAALLRRCLGALSLLADDHTDLIVALDGKDLQSVAECECEVDAFVSKLGGGRSVEEAFVDEFLDAPSEQAADEIAERWRRSISIQRLPTTLVVEERGRRRKGDALNLVLSLCGRRCLWLRFDQAEVLVVASSLVELRQRYSQTVAAQGCPSARSLFAVPWPDYYLGVDVDEVVVPERLRRLQAIAESSPDLALVQCVKVDEPNSASIASHAFYASYASWFHWEGTWPSQPRGGPWSGCSYYGSLAAIRLAPEKLHIKRMALAGGQTFDGCALFADNYAIEDFDFFSKKLFSDRTRMLEFSAARGDAPIDLPALLALWARWTKDNVSIILYDTLPKLASAPWTGQTIALAYHGMSWFTYGNLPLIALLVSVCAAAGWGAASSVLGWLAVVVFALEVARRSVPVPGVRAWQHAARFPAEFLLFPVAWLLSVAGAIAPWANIARVRLTTPRDRVVWHLPRWIALTYIAYAFTIFSPWAYRYISRHEPPAVAPAFLAAALLYGAWCFISYIALVADKFRSARVPAAGTCAGAGSAFAANLRGNCPLGPERSRLVRFGDRRIELEFGDCGQETVIAAVKELT
jgi:hypothetical protein